METREYFEKVIQDYNQNRNGRNLRKYCSDEGIDYKWLSSYKKQYSSTKTRKPEEQPSLLPLQVIDERFSEHTQVETPLKWVVRKLVLVSPSGEEVILLVSNAVQSKMYIYDND